MANTTTREIIAAHWAYANQTDWHSFSQLLADDLYYEVPQTREYLHGGHAYLDMFKTWPGPWQVEIKELICEADKAISVIDFHSQGEIQRGLSIFRVQNGKICKVTDYWPEAYEPPQRLCAYMQRHPAP